jgi:hypothetical protein
LAVLSVLLSACGGGGDDSTAQIQTPPPSGTAFGIAGAPLTSWLQGRSYSFMPSAHDPDGKTLNFSVSGLPGWATFDSNTGRISGTPSAGQVGTYPDIVISVSNGTSLVSLQPFSLSIVAVAAGSATLSWIPPTVRTDGSSLTDLAGYKLYWGVEPGDAPNITTLNSSGIASYVIDQLTPATWYFSVTAIDANGGESPHSTEASKTVR